MGGAGSFFSESDILSRLNSSGIYSFDLQKAVEWIKKPNIYTLKPLLGCMILLGNKESQNIACECMVSYVETRNNVVVTHISTACLSSYNCC